MLGLKKGGKSREERFGELTKANPCAGWNCYLSYVNSQGGSKAAEKED